MVLPFGLSPAPYVFTKLIRPFVKKWRGQGIRSVVFIGNGALGERKKEFNTRDCGIVFNDFSSAVCTHCVRGVRQWRE